MSWIKRILLNRATIGVLLLICLASVVPTRSYSDNTERSYLAGAFYRGQLHYDAGDHDKAISEYEDILKRWLKSGNIYYNLGNSYLKKGAAGKAILNYERAEAFEPRDSALLTNHRYVSTLMKQRDTPDKAPLLLQELNQVFDLLTPRETILFFILIYYGFVIFFIAQKFVKKLRLFLRIAAAVFLCLILAAALPSIDKLKKAENSAIVIDSIADAKIEPFEGASSNFPLYEGMKVYIIGCREGWYKVKRPDGKIGWIYSNKIALVNQ